MKLNKIPKLWLIIGGLFTFLLIIWAIIQITKPSSLPPTEADYSAEEVEKLKQESKQKSQTEISKIKLSQTENLPNPDNFNLKRTQNLEQQLVYLSNQTGDLEYKVIKSTANNCQIETKSLAPEEYQDYNNQTELKFYTCQFAIQANSGIYAVRSFNSSTHEDDLAIEIKNLDSKEIIFSSLNSS